MMVLHIDGYSAGKQAGFKGSETLSYCLLRDVYICSYGANNQPISKYLHISNNENHHVIWLLPYCRPQQRQQILWCLPQIP